MVINIYHTADRYHNSTGTSLIERRVTKTHENVERVMFVYSDRQGAIGY